jgi:cytochrome c556
MKKTITIALILGTALAGTALAHGGATGIVKERMDAMSDMKDSMKALSGLIRNGADDGTAIAGHARDIAGHAGDTMLDQFPEDSLEHPSEALPEIWSEPERFRELAMELEEFASALAEQAESGDEAELTTTFKQVAATCGTCHKAYRAD